MINLVDLAHPPFSDAVTVQLARNDAYVRRGVMTEALFNEAPTVKTGAVSTAIAVAGHSDAPFIKSFIRTKDRSHRAMGAPT